MKDTVGKWSRYFERSTGDVRWAGACGSHTRPQFSSRFLGFVKPQVAIIDLGLCALLLCLASGGRLGRLVFVCVLWLESFAETCIQGVQCVNEISFFGSLEHVGKGCPASRCGGD